jgi:hypothetical protein
MEQLVPVEEVYQGFYARFKPQDKRGMDYLAGAEGIVGAKLRLSQFGDVLGFAAHDGTQIALLEEELSERLMWLREQGWVLCCVMASTMYCADDKSFTGEFAGICYHSQLDTEAKEALEVFINNIADRIAGATRPGLTLTQEQFTRVIESKGAWFLTKEEPWPELPRGVAVYRRRQTFNDRLISAALKGNKGCIVVSWIGAAIVVVIIFGVIWFFFLSTP